MPKLIAPSMRTSSKFSLIFALATIVAALAGANAWHEGRLLRTQLDLRSEAREELMRLTAENARLQAALPAADVIAGWRKERRAIHRLETELTNLQQQITRREATLH